MLNFGEIFLLFLLNLSPSHREGPAVNNLSSLYITIDESKVCEQLLERC